MADDPPPVSFLKDVAPILVQNCIACHNPKKSESKYTMTTFAQLAKGGVRGKGITLVGGDPDASYFVELCRPDGDPRMPYKQDPHAQGEARRHRALGQGRRQVRRRRTVRGLARRAPQGHAGQTSPTPIRPPSRSPRWRSAPTARRSSPRASTSSPPGKTLDGTPGRRLRGMAERIHEVAYSPDGKWLATASGDPGQFGSVQLWIAEPDGGGKLARDLLETTDSAFAVAFSPDGTKLAAAGRRPRREGLGGRHRQGNRPDRGPRRLDLRPRLEPRREATRHRQPGQDEQSLRRREEGIRRHLPRPRRDGLLAWSSPSDGKSVVTGGRRQPDPRLEPRRGRQAGPGRRRAPAGAVFRLTLSPDGKTLLSCGADKAVRVFENFVSKHILTGHNDWVYSVALSPDAKTVASGSWDGEVRLWNLADGKPIRTILAAPGYKPDLNAQAGEVSRPGSPGPIISAVHRGWVHACPIRGRRSSSRNCNKDVCMGRAHGSIFQGSVRRGRLASPRGSG